MLEDEFLTPEEWLMDYAQLDAIVKPIIEELDHHYIVSEENVAMEDPYWVIADRRDDAVHMQVERSTVECMSQWLANQVSESLHLLDRDTICVSVTMRESSKSSCTYTM
jgi:6-pyruvoyl-tetrahydropterin synthase